MNHWLYRYIFRGIVILALIGVITFLFLAIYSHDRNPNRHVFPLHQRSA